MFMKKFELKLFHRTRIRKLEGTREKEPISHIPLVFIMCFVISFMLLSAGIGVASATDLVGSWHLDEGSGTIAYDSSGNGNDGAIYGATWTTGKNGSALEFDGVDDYVNCGNDPSLNIADEITVIAWIYPTGKGDSNYPRIVDKSSSTSGTAPGYKIYPRAAEDYKLTLCWWSG
jgi:hypothetical protein